MIYWLDKMYGNVLANSYYPKIINQHHYQRLVALIKQQNDLIGGKMDDKSLKISPTIISNCSFDNVVMQEEIFGPILPIIPYDNLDDAINLVKEHDSPLATYIFSNDQKYIDQILTDVSFGGGCVNDVVMHLANYNLPFGGVGSSGMGNYHGEYSLKTFSHEKGILLSKTYLDIPLRYLPFTNKKLKIVKKIFK